MPRGTTPEEVLSRVGWVRLLPDSAWAHGICDTADSLVAELTDLEQERKVIDDKIKSRLKVLRLIPARAEREAGLMHDKAEVEEAAPKRKRKLKKA